MIQSRGQSLKRKADELNDIDMLNKIQAYPGASVGLVAIDVRYHMPCINAYISKRRKRQIANSDVKDKDATFVLLTEEFHTHMIVNKCVMCLSAICDRHRILLHFGLRRLEVTTSIPQSLHSVMLSK